MSGTPPTSHSGVPTRLLALPTVVAREFAGWQRSAEGHSSAPIDSSTRPIGTLDGAELRFLHAVAADPGQPSSAYPKIAKVSPRRALLIRERLVSLGYVVTHRVNRAGKGRDAIVLEVTDRGHAELRGYAKSAGAQL